MKFQPGEAREVPDLEAEADRLAGARNALPRSVVGPGYTLRVHWPGGDGLARVTSVEPDGNGGFVIRAEAWEP